MRARRPDTVVFTVVVTVLVMLCALPMAALVLLSGAPQGTAIGLVLAALPVGPLVWVFLWLDRYEPEPRSLLVLGLAWGGCVATVAALVIGGIGGAVLSIPESLSLAVVAPVTEEASKGLFLLILLWWRRHMLDGVLDGIVYAGMVGIGFAFVENILYLASAYNGAQDTPGGLVPTTTLFVVRCLFSPFAHPLFTAFTGIGVGIAVTTRNPLLRWTAPVLGYLLAVTAHALWNGSTLRGMSGFLAVYVVVMVPAFILLAAFALWMRSSERTLLTRALDEAVRGGLLPAGDVPWIADLTRRRAARVYASTYGGPLALKHTRRYQELAIQLAYLHHRYLRGTAPRDFAARGRYFMQEMQAIRPSIRFPEQAVPHR